MNKLYEITILVPQKRAIVAEDIKYAANVAKATVAHMTGAFLFEVKELPPPETKNDSNL